MIFGILTYTMIRQGGQVPIGMMALFIIAEVTIECVTIFSSLG